MASSKEQWNWRNSSKEAVHVCLSFESSSFLVHTLWKKWKNRACFEKLTFAQWRRHQENSWSWAPFEARSSFGRHVRDFNFIDVNSSQFAKVEAIQLLGYMHKRNGETHALKTCKSKTKEYCCPDEKTKLTYGKDSSQRKDLHQSKRLFGNWETKRFTWKLVEG